DLLSAIFFSNCRSRKLPENYDRQPPIRTVFRLFHRAISRDGKFMLPPFRLRADPPFHFSLSTIELATKPVHLTSLPIELPALVLIPTIGPAELRVAAGQQSVRSAWLELAFDQ